jgi:hypothetical protein
VNIILAPVSEAPSVFMVAPFTAKDLSQRSMADVIFDLQVQKSFITLGSSASALIEIPKTFIYSLPLKR